MNKTKQDYLQEVLETHRMSKIDDTLRKYQIKRDEVKTLIEDNYNSRIYSPINSGSFAKHAAINSKFDLDIVVPFKKDSFSKLEHMFDNIYHILNTEYNSVAEVRKQKVSIGINFYQDNISLDIVPGREHNQDQYNDDKNLNLFVHSQYGTMKEKGYIKTNIQAQIDHIKAKENERKIIRLLKVWKTKNNEQYKSFLLELLAIKAFEKEGIDGNLWEKLQAVLHYIKDNVAQESFTLKDPGNSGNNVIDTLNSNERQNLSNTMGNIIQNIEHNEDNIKTYFPINENFKSIGYGVKTAGISASIPPNSTRFG